MSRKQIFKGTTLYKTRVVNHILKVYRDDTFDFNSDWYKETFKLANTLGVKHNVSSLKVAGIIAALSPLKSWTENKKIAISFLEGKGAKHTRLMVNKAQSILDSTECNEVETILNILNGNKIKNFFLNIAFPNGVEAVTIDRHALSICLNRNVVKKEAVGITDIQYNFFLSCFVEAAAILEIRPSMVQSVTWEKWRELKKLN